MIKKLIAVIVFLLLVLLAMCVTIFRDRNENVDEGNPSVATEAEQTTEPTMPEETEEATEMATMPGVEDSIFDDEDEQETEAPSNEKKEDPEVNGNKDTNHNQSASGNNQQSGSNGNKKPEADATKPTEAPEEQQPTAPTQKPTEPAGEPEKPDGGTSSPGAMSYEQYQSMSPGEQQAYMNSFESIDAFFAWYNAAKEQYEIENPPIDVGDGSIDLGEVIGGNG